MAWTQSSSLSFTARYAASHEQEAQAVLEALEEHRERLDGKFPRLPDNVTIVIHDSLAQLLLAHPWLAVARRLTSPAGRRYMAGWYSRNEVHCVSPAVLRRAAGSDESLKAMLLTPQRYYSMLAVGLCNPLLPTPFRPRTVIWMLRRSWQVEGAAQYFSGQIAHLRAALAHRLREGTPRFPPPARDAALLGGTVYDLLAEQRGERACVRLACHPERGDERTLLESAFDAPRHEITQMWRAHIEQLSSAKASVRSLEG
jgi:hypothetical protein